jgi:hypothetical protein
VEKAPRPFEQGTDSQRAHDIRHAIADQGRGNFVQARQITYNIDGFPEHRGVYPNFGNSITAKAPRRKDIRMATAHSDSWNGEQRPKPLALNA